MMNIKAFTAFVALFAVLGGAFVLSAETDETDATNFDNSLTIKQGETKTWTYQQLYDTSYNAEFAGDLDYAVSLHTSPVASSNDFVSVSTGYVLTSTTTGVTFTVPSNFSTGVYYICIVIMDEAGAEAIVEDSSKITVQATESSEGDLSFTNTAPTQGISGSSYNYTPTTNIPANFSKSGTWPSWLTLNTSTGKVSGTLPTVSSVQTYSAVIHAVSKTLSSNTADQTITIHNYPVATISASGGNTVSGTTGTSLSKSLSGNLSMTFAVKSGSNTLPTGLSISSSGVISGTPTQACSNYKVTIQGTTASNAGPAQSPTIVITFNIVQAEDSLQITSAQPSGVKKVGDSVDYSLASNVTGTVFTLVNAPSWLSIDSNNHIRGSVPTSYTAATDVTFTIKATSPQGQTATQTPTISIQPTLKFTSKPTASCIVIPIYSYADDGTVDAGIIEDIKAGFHSVTDKKVVGYQFVFVGTNADSIHWDFGDGSEADGFTVEHRYSAAGTYTVTCTATNEYEAQDGTMLTGTDVCTVEVTIDAEAGDYIYAALLVFVLIIVVVLVLKLIVARRH